MILVTGSTGFVGTALCADLTRRGLPFRPASRVARRGHVAVGDIGPATDWSAALIGADTIIHLAARVHVMRDTATDPLAEFRRANVDSTLNLARQFAAAGGKRFVFVSSIKVNGERTKPGRAYKASDAPAPMDPYGQSKAEAETELFTLGRQTGLEIVVVRPPLIYGPGVKANFARMVQWVRCGFPLPLASVRNARSLVFVGNLTDLLVIAAHHPEAPENVFLVSDGHDVSTPELLQAIAKELGRHLALIRCPPSLLYLGAKLLGKHPIADRLLGNLQVDIEKTRRVLDWTPPILFADAIAASVGDSKAEKR